MPPQTDWTMEPEVRELKEWLGEDVNKLNFIDFLTGAGGRMIERLRQEAVAEHDSIYHPINDEMKLENRHARLALIEGLIKAVDEQMDKHEPHLEVSTLNRGAYVALGTFRTILQSKVEVAPDTETKK